MEIADKIKKLLALATSPNEHEARLATEKANELLIRYNLSMQNIENKPDYESADLYEPGRMPSEAIYIAQLLNTYFFVKAIRSHSGYRQSKIYIVGTKSNVEVAHYIYKFLLQAYRNGWKNYKAIHQSDTKNKRTYYQGFTIGLSEQLETKLKVVEKETGLMVIPDQALTRYIKEELNCSGTHRHNVRHRDLHAMNAGKNDGKNLQIRSAVTTESVNGQLSLTDKRK